MKVMFICGALIVLSVPAVFMWVGYLAFGHARVDGVNVIPAMIFVGLCLGAWTIFLQALDMVNDYIATRAKADISQVQGDVAAGIREGVKLQREQGATLAATIRAMQMAQPNNGPEVPAGGLDYEDR